jgi:hypothetical protein
MESMSKSISQLGISDLGFGHSSNGHKSHTVLLITTSLSYASLLICLYMQLCRQLVLVAPCNRQWWGDRGERMGRGRSGLEACLSRRPSDKSRERSARGYVRLGLGVTKSDRDESGGSHRGATLVFWDAKLCNMVFWKLCLRWTHIGNEDSHKTFSCSRPDSRPFYAHPCGHT